jgi:hypothetical protein
MLSTVYDSSMVSTGKRNLLTGEEILKPLCVKEYNQNKGTVDNAYMQKTFSESLRKSVKWYKKLFFLCDGFIGSQRLYFIQKYTTTTSSALPIQT